MVGGEIDRNGTHMMNAGEEEKVAAMKLCQMMRDTDQEGTDVVEREIPGVTMTLIMKTNVKRSGVSVVVQQTLTISMRMNSVTQTHTAVINLIPVPVVTVMTVGEDEGGGNFDQVPVSQSSLAQLGPSVDKMAPLRA